MEPSDLVLRILLVGIGATALMDVWLLALQRVGVPTLDFALIGRWVGHGARGRLVHAAIRRALPVRHERALGWAVHYAVGIGFAAVLVGLQGDGWLRQPSLWPALAWGLATTAVPLFVMQPAMGAGVASSRTPTPWRNRLRSLVNHAVFGLGLYASAATLAATRSATPP